MIVGDGSTRPGLPDPAFVVPCRLPPTGLGLFERLAVKLAFNTVSTATLGSLAADRQRMAHVETSNKKLIDRGSRLNAELAEVTTKRPASRSTRPSPSIPRGRAKRALARGDPIARLTGHQGSD